MATVGSILRNARAPSPDKEESRIDLVQRLESLERKLERCLDRRGALEASYKRATDELQAREMAYLIKFNRAMKELRECTPAHVWSPDCERRAHDTFERSARDVRLASRGA
jgi:hypothetical protein